MIDYRANVAALDEFRDSLANSVIANPKLAKLRDEQVQNVDQSSDMALLGAMTGHLMWHAATPPGELELVERAAQLWRFGLSLNKLIGQFRENLEGALSDPTSPDAVQKFNQAMQARESVASGIAGKEVEIAILREDIYKAAHPAAHPRQEDKKLKQWNWADIFLARRTDAFARATWKHADDADTKAFAFGVLSSYGANVSGSAYLGQVVGGPRRAHRHRDRLARNAVGSWFAQFHPSSASLDGIADRIGYGLFTPTLPAKIETLIVDSLTETYDLSRTPPLPDLQSGYKRLIRHLNALSTFVMPPTPAMPMQPFLTKIYGDTGNPSFSIVEAGVAHQNSSGGGSGGVTPQSGPHGGAVGTEDSKRNSKLDCGAFFMGLFQFIAGTALLWGPCWEDWADGKDCKLWEGMKHDFGEWWASLGGGQGAPGQAGTTAGGLTTASMSQQVIDLIHSLYDMHNRCWEALNVSYWYLSRAGLIYPDVLLDRNVFKNLLSIPPSAAAGWPHLPVANPDEQCHLHPTTPIEQPAVDQPAFPAGSQPSVFLKGTATGGVTTAPHISTMVWMQIAAGDVDTQNYDMDADRRITHSCWDVGGSINDSPINVVGLNYTET